MVTLMKNTYAEVVKLVDTHVSGACGASYAGSSPAFGTDSQEGHHAWCPSYFSFFNRCTSD